MAERLEVTEVKWEQNGRPSPLWEEVMRLLLQRPLTTPDDGVKVLDEGPIQKEEDDG